MLLMLSLKLETFSSWVLASAFSVHRLGGLIKHIARHGPVRGVPRFHRPLQIAR